MFPDYLSASKVVVIVGQQSKTYEIETSHYRENPTSPISRIEIQNIRQNPICEIVFEDGERLYYLHPFIVSFEEKRVTNT